MTSDTQTFGPMTKEESTINGTLPPTTHPSGAVKIHPPDLFYGQRDRHSLTTRLEDFDLYFTLKHVNTDEERVLTCVTYLRGAAKEWWRYHHRQFPTTAFIPSWESFKNSLLHDFMDPNAADHAMDHLTRLRQTTSVADYVNKFRQALTQLPHKLTDEDSRYRFIDGLKPFIKRTMLAQGRPATLNEAMATAERIDSVMFDTRRPWVPNYGKRMTPYTSTSTSTPMEVDNIQRRREGPSRTPTNGRDDRNTRRTPFTGRCYQCNKPGHMAKDCPQAARNRQYRRRDQMNSLAEDCDEEVN
jgi:Ty3 transposon capsid-like protein/Zinc knuckle